MAESHSLGGGVTVTAAGVDVSGSQLRVPPEFGAALTRSGFTHRASFSAGLTPIPAGAEAVAAVEPASLSVEVARSDQVGTVLLVDHGNGVYTWARSAPAGNAERVLATPEPQVFDLIAELPALAPAPEGAMALGIPSIVRKAVSVFSYPLISGVANAVIKDRELHHHPYRLRLVRDDPTQDVAADQLTPDEWAAIGSGPALLLLHGIFGTSRGTFSGVLEDHPGLTYLMPALRAKYGDRILAFDHPTVSVGPVENAKEFLARIPADQQLVFDVLVHSRGGLVARCINGEAGELDHKSVTFKKIVFVGTPNHGSAIASPENLGQLIDRFTSFLSVVPPLGPVGTVTAVMTSVLEVVKVFGQGIEGGMPGLTDMAPESTLIATLDAPDTAESPVFFEIDANYEPAGSLLSLTHDADRIEDDLVFAKVANDVAVPSTGVGNVDPGTDPRFPIPEDQSHHYPAGNVWHCSYFDAEPTHQLLGSWLPT